MKFPYKKYGPGFVRPVIPVTITYKNRSVKYEVLVDSGADSCIFNAALASILDLDLYAGQKDIVGGVTGINEPLYIHPVTLEVGGHAHQIRAGFLEHITSSGYGVVGQQGFFDLFVVKFDLLKEEIELLPRKK